VASLTACWTEMLRALLLLAVMVTTCLGPAAMAGPRVAADGEHASVDHEALPRLAWLFFAAEELEELEELEGGESLGGPEVPGPAGSPLPRRPNHTAPRPRPSTSRGAGRCGVAVFEGVNDRRAWIRRRRPAAHVPRMDDDPAAI